MIPETVSSATLGTLPAYPLTPSSVSFRDSPGSAPFLLVECSPVVFQSVNLAVCLVYHAGVLAHVVHDFRTDFSGFEQDVPDFSVV